jgi:acetyl-CoA C-acetyltransferase
MDRIRPIIAGAGQFANKDEERVLHPGDLLEEAARRALADAGGGFESFIGAVYSSPLSAFGDLNGAELVAERLHLGAGPRIVDPGFSGTGPLHLLDEACARIAEGSLEAALIVGAVADASVRRARARGEDPPAPPAMPLSLGSDGTTGSGRVRATSSGAITAEAAAGVSIPAAHFALAESRIATVMGHSPSEHRAFLGEFLEPFTEVAASHPELAWFPHARRAAEISETRSDNRLVAEPYTKLMCSFPTVDLAAAIVVTSTVLADRLGVPSEQRVQPWGIARASEPRPLSERRAMHTSGALAVAAGRLLEASDVELETIEAFDFYSCFPAAVQVAAAGIGLASSDPRGRTLTGGMPYFGGPGASYGMHGLAEMVERCRVHPGSIGAVIGIGGMLEKFAVGLFSTELSSRPYHSERRDDIADLLVAEATPISRSWDGPGTIYAGTVLHDRDRGPIAAPIIADLPDGSRIGARAPDTALPGLSGSALVGENVRIFTRDGDAYYEPV